MSHVRKHTRTLRNGRKVTVHSHERDQQAGTAADAAAAPGPLPAGTPIVGDWTRGGVSSNLADPWGDSDPVWEGF